MKAIAGAIVILAASIFALGAAVMANCESSYQYYAGAFWYFAVPLLLLGLYFLCFGKDRPNN